MPLKYQKEIDNFEFLIVCPDNAKAPDKEIEAFRFSYTPINHQLNFLPNVVWDRLTNNSFFNYSQASDVMKCMRCGASYYTTFENAQRKWNVLTEQIREKLGYTHIAYGKLDSQDGVMRNPDKGGHFGFYENDNADLTKKFDLVAEL